MTDTHDKLKRPLRVGLTGGIASGKTTVAEMFREFGAKIIDTDVIARDLVAVGEPALDEIHHEFGDAVFDGTGALDRAAMRSIVFADDNARSRLEGILHPRIRQATESQAENVGGDYQIIVVPLLVESPLREFLDRVLVVDCREETQIRRLMARDAESEGQARRILAAQASREARLAIADDVIQNGDDLGETLEQVRQLHNQYCRLSQP